MIHRLFTLALLLGVRAATLSAQGARDASPADRARDVAITHVTVIDVAGGRRLPDQTVVVRGTRIEVVRPATRTTPPRGARIIDGRGKFLVPGLWDMHVHLSTTGSDRTRIPLLLAHGITGVRAMSQECMRDCAGDPFTLDSIRAWREATARGVRLFPRLVVSGPSIDGPKPARTRAWPAATAEEGAAGVRLTRERGGDFVKVYSLLPRAAFFGAVREARQLGLPVAGHVPASLWPSEASDSGMASLEHDLGIWEECSTRHAEWRSRLDSLSAVGGGAGFAGISGFVTTDVMESYDDARCRALFATLRRNRTWLVPTLVLRQGFARQVDGENAARDTRLRYVPRAQRAAWQPGADFRASALGRAGAAARMERRRREPALVARAYAAGVRILAGTDMGNPYVFAGSSLHEELQLLVEGGLTPAQALRAATLEPASFLHATDSLGSIAPGKLADLVLLHANPLADVANTQRIHAVMANGRYLDRTALDALLADAERAAAASP
ncbi:MAG TPA: amidohydrolase family protein [Gemmatimonadaceae bacterium]|nr:amidohydrolase family protein [Gemmatimonadaceae bacterium]